MFMRPRCGSANARITPTIPNGRTLTFSKPTGARSIRIRRRSARCWRGSPTRCSFRSMPALGCTPAFGKVAFDLVLLVAVLAISLAFLLAAIWAADWGYNIFSYAAACALNNHAPQCGTGVPSLFDFTLHPISSLQKFAWPAIAYVAVLFIGAYAATQLDYQPLSYLCGVLPAQAGKPDGSRSARAASALASVVHGFACNRSRFRP